MKAKKFKATEADGDTTDGVGGMNLQTRATVPGPETANQLAGSTTNKKCYRRFANLCSTYSGSLDTEEHVPAAMHPAQRFVFVCSYVCLFEICVHFLRTVRKL